MDEDQETLSPEEIVRRRDAAIRRALNTPHKPIKELIGKTERAKTLRETKALRARNAEKKED